MSEFAYAKNADSYAYWGDVNEAGNGGLSLNMWKKLSNFRAEEKA